MKFTANIEQGESGWFVAQVAEVPAAMSQGKTIEELRKLILSKRAAKLPFFFALPYFMIG